MFTHQIWALKFLMRLCGGNHVRTKNLNYFVQFLLESFCLCERKFDGMLKITKWWPNKWPQKCYFF